MGPQARLLPDGRRLHLQHGPIDLVVEAWSKVVNSNRVMLRSAEGASRSTQDDGACFETQAAPAPQHDAVSHLDPGVRDAYRAAAARFVTILDELCAELPEQRLPIGPQPCRLRGAIARRMDAATRPFAAYGFITPMAAVAGAVAEEVLGAMLAAAPLRRAAVNNGGDIALHLGPGESLRVGLVDRPDRPNLFGTTTLRAGDGIAGVATSGWRGRSFSLGIADAVTILARTASEADGAATVVANAVDLPGHAGVIRAPARDVQADSDLGERLVTRAVGQLSPGEVDEALGRGLAMADDLVGRGLIRAACLHVQGRTRSIGRCDPSPLAGEGGLRISGGRMRGPVSDHGHPSSVTASPCFLLPRRRSRTGEKEPARLASSKRHAEELHS